MIYKSILVFFVSLKLAFSFEHIQDGRIVAARDCFVTHIISAGETLRNIGRRYNLSWEELLRINPNISDPNNLTAGMSINIPCPPRTLDRDTESTTFEYVRDDLNPTEAEIP
jgi:hypothetical protein